MLSVPEAQALVLCKPCPAAALRGAVDACSNFALKGILCFLNSWSLLRVTAMPVMGLATDEFFLVAFKNQNNPNHEVT